MFSSVLLLAAAVLLDAAADSQFYVKRGGGLLLTPLHKADTVAAVSWKHNENIVAEWAHLKYELEFWGVLKGRATLDKTTGVLNITNMTTETGGRYTVEINNYLQKDGYRVVVLEDVPRPEVLPQPLACPTTSQNCSLVCDGNTGGAEPVTFFWRREGGDWKQEGRTIRIFKEPQARTWSCRMKNPVSSQDSPPFPDPFHKDQSGPLLAGVLVMLVVLVVLVVGAVLLGKFCRNREAVSKWVARFNGRSREAPPVNENGAADRPENRPLTHPPPGEVAENP